MLMIDPPSGWQYGFPKAFVDRSPEETVEEWLVRNGYPQKEVDYWIERGWGVPCRYWEGGLV